MYQPTASDKIYDLESELEWIDSWTRQLEAAVAAIVMAPDFAEDAVNEQLEHIESLIEGLSVLSDLHAQDIERLTEPQVEFDTWQEYWND